MTLEIITVFFYSLTHCFIDLTSSLVVYNSAIVHGLTQPEAVSLIIMYDLIAFALQPFAGFLIDFVKGSRIALLTGIVLLLTAVILVRINAISAGIAAGLGNALFHLGAGSQILGRYPGRSSIIGIFVGPGALGLSIGFWFGNLGFFPFRYLITGFIILSIIFVALPSLRSIPIQSNKISPKNGNRFLIVILLLIVVMVRGFAGRTGFAGIHQEAFAVIGLGVAACVGKMIGGITADRFGWGFTAIITLILSGIGIIFVENHLYFAFASMILYQMTMPITLAAISTALPGKPASAFGLTCLALIIGTLPAFYVPPILMHLPFTLILIGISGVCVIAALRRIEYSELRINEKFEIQTANEGVKN